MEIYKSRRTLFVVSLLTTSLLTVAAENFSTHHMHAHHDHSAHSSYHSSIDETPTPETFSDSLITTLITNSGSDTSNKRHDGHVHHDSSHNHGTTRVNMNHNHDLHANHDDHGEEIMLLDQAAPEGNDLIKSEMSGKDLKHEHHQTSHVHKDEHGDMDGMNKNNSGDHDMMMMHFHGGVDETILFKEWKVTTVGGMIGSVVGIILLAMFYEGLKYFREYLFKQYISSMQFSTVAVTGESGKITQVHKVERHRMMSLAHGMQTGLHMIQIVMSYFLMLIFMTYNVWLCLAVVIGAGAGYFIFGWKKATVVDITEHCH